MRDAFEISHTIIDALRVGDEPTVTNLMLNKLLYFAQGHCLARTGKPLFDNHIEAWRLGPVVPDVYDAYRKFSSCPIIIPDTERKPTLSDAQFNVLVDVIAEYGKYSASYLVELSHRQGSPWSNSNSSETISLESMKEYFRKPENSITPLENVLKSLPTVSALPKDWYDPEEDEVWAQYQ